MNTELDRLIEEIQSETRWTRGMTGVSAITPEVVEALRATPREAFVGDGQQACAYLNQPLPVGYGQTISQPFIVAIMTQLLLPQAAHTVLEIGSGSGYQAAVLAHLVKQVISIEIIPQLADMAAKRLRGLAIDNVGVHCADGYHGWPDQAPYDGVIVTACAPYVPPALTGQLKAGGRMVIPVGEAHGYQELRLIEKSADAKLTERSVLSVAFVPLTRSRPAK